MYVDSRDILIALALKFKGKWDYMYRAMERREFPEPEYYDQINKIKSKVVTMLDENYPSFLALSRKSIKKKFYCLI